MASVAAPMSPDTLASIRVRRSDPREKDYTSPVADSERAGDRLRDGDPRGRGFG
jgi:hypothetical protein